MSVKGISNFETIPLQWVGSATFARRSISLVVDQPPNREWKSIISGQFCPRTASESPNYQLSEVEDAKKIKNSSKICVIRPNLIKETIFLSLLEIQRKSFCLDWRSITESELLRFKPMHPPHSCIRIIF